MTEPLPALMHEYFHPFRDAVKSTKELLVKEEGIGTDMAPTFSVVRCSDKLVLTGSCHNREQRMLSMAPFSTRWMNLCRQVVTLTQADVTFAAIEIYIPDPEGDPEKQGEAIEISMITREHVVTTLMPYVYDAGRAVIWLPEAGADPNDLNRAGCLEIDASRLAWYTSPVAYPGSVRHLSGACGTNWTGHPLLLSAILGQN